MPITLHYNYAFIHLDLLHCLEVWGNAFNSHIQPLFLVHYKVIRIINCSYNKAFSNLTYSTLNILFLQKLTTQGIALMMYKYLHDMLQHLRSVCY